MTLDLLAQHDEQALSWIDKIKSLEQKTSAKLLTGLTARSLVAARKAGAEGSQAYKDAFQSQLTQQLQALPWDVVQDDVQQQRGMAEILSENVIMGMVQSQIDPVVANSHELSGDMADRVIGLHFALEDILPLREQRLAALNAIVDAHKEAKTDIWPARELTLPPGKNYSPVVVGIWDSGVDVSVYKNLLWTNPNETLDGKDDDGNGFVDDLHGIAYDLQGNPSPDLLHPEGDQQGKVADAMHYMKGIMDLQAAIQSDAASEVRQHLAKLPADQMKDFMTSLGFVGLYAHGTHVAGIATRGNPYAKILVSRITFDYHTLPAAITKEIAQRHAASYAASAKYFKAAKVRVVNMSWGWTFREIESSLEANGIGKTAEERKAMAEEIFGILDEGLKNAIESCPNILFVVAAGNDDSDVSFHRTIPSSYEMPNVLVVGAVDQEGKRTNFTSMGENVVVYSNGFEVESYVPGGERMALSGTSMASPNVMNLAAKLVAMRPNLTPPEIIALIEKGADSLSDQPNLKLINPKATAALLAEQ
jgi:subtilisin family serine protease